MKKTFRQSKNIEDIRGSDTQRDKMRSVTYGNQSNMQKAWDSASIQTKDQRQSGRALGLSPALADLQNQANKVQAVRRTRINGQLDNQLLLNSINKGPDAADKYGKFYKSRLRSGKAQNGMNF